MDDDTRNDLIAAVWAALDNGADDDTVRDEVDQALHTYTPSDSQ